MTDGAWQKAAHRSAPNGKSISGERFSNLLRLIFPDFVNAYPKNHQRIEVRYVDAVS